LILCAPLFPFKKEKKIFLLGFRAKGAVRRGFAEWLAGKNFSPQTPPIFARLLGEKIFCGGAVYIYLK
jgi:hypothetical protein